MISVDCCPESRHWTGSNIGARMTDMRLRLNACDEPPSGSNRCEATIDQIRSDSCWFQSFSAG